MSFEGYDHLMELIKATKDAISWHDKPLKEELKLLETQQKLCEAGFDTKRFECFEDAYRVTLEKGQLYLKDVNRYNSEIRIFYKDWPRIRDAIDAQFAAIKKHTTSGLGASLDEKH